MASKRIDYQQRYKAIKRFVSLDVNPKRLNSAQKRIITNLYNRLAPRHGVSTHTRFLKTTNKRVIAQASAKYQTPKSKYLKGVFVPNRVERIRVNKRGRLVVREAGGTTETLPVDRKEFVADPIAALEKIARGRGKNTRYVMTVNGYRTGLHGAGGVPDAFSLEGMKDQVRGILRAYKTRIQEGNLTLGFEIIKTKRASTKLRNEYRKEMERANKKTSKKNRGNRRRK